MNSDAAKLVIANDVDTLPDDLPDDQRFFVSAVRAAAHPDRSVGLTIFVHSGAARQDAGPGGCRAVHMQDGHGEITNRIVFCGRESNNGWVADFMSSNLSNMFDELEARNLQDRWIVVWDGTSRKAFFYPNGINEEEEYSAINVPISADIVSQDDLCAALNELYNEHMKTPSAHTVKIWVKGVTNKGLEDEIERHLKGSLQAFFSGRSRRVKILPQTNNNAGRADLMILQRGSSTSGPEIVGVLELKVLRGSDDASVALEGLQQGHHYREDLELPFATLALYDVGANLTHETASLMAGVAKHLTDAVRVRRFPLYKSAGDWRRAGGYFAG